MSFRTELESNRTSPPFASAFPAPPPLLAEKIVEAVISAEEGGREFGVIHFSRPHLACLDRAGSGWCAAFQSPDNWNMASVTVAAIGYDVGARIAGYGYHRFTGSDPVLTIPARIPANVCSSGRPTGNSGSGSNSGSASGAGSNSTSAPGSLQSITGNSGQGRVGSASGALTNQDVARMAKAGVPESAIIASIQT
jgi:hypothetical protein